MLLKVSLIIAILAGIATLVVSQLQVKEAIVGLKDQLSSTQTELATTQTDLEKSKKDEKAAREQAETTAKKLAETESALETAASNWKTQEARANRFENDFKKAAGDLSEAQRDLAAWQAVGIPVEMVRNRLAELEKVRRANDGLNEENRVLIRKVTSLSNELAKYTADKETPPELPPGLKGKVLQVDPKWDFVVLDIGSNQGLVERGEMLVNRGGKLVAKIRVTSVEANRAIANVLPAWKQADVLEGDVVMH